MPEYPQTVLDDIRRLQDQVRELTTRVASIPSDATAAPWLPIASFGSGWADLHTTDSGFDLVGVQVRPGGRVAMRGGVMRSGSSWPGAGFTLLTLPSDLLPATKQTFTAGSPYGNGFVNVEAGPSGALVVTGWGGNTTGQAGTAVGLDLITYRTS